MVLGKSKDGNDVYFADIWPSHDEISHLEETFVRPELFREVYANIEVCYVH